MSLPHIETGCSPDEDLWLDHHSLRFNDRLTCKRAKFTILDQHGSQGNAANMAQIVVLGSAQARGRLGDDGINPCLFEWRCLNARMFFDGLGCDGGALGGRWVRQR
jgi:hypothetical protein